MVRALFWTFLKIGLFTFGGGYAMIANIREVVVEQRKWLDDEELMQVITIAESTPGPIAINLATYVGFKKKGIWGSTAATVGVVLPSMVIIYGISLFLDAFMTNRIVQYAFVGIQCAVAFLILKAGLDMFAKLPKKLLPRVMFSVVLVLLLMMELLSISLSSILLILLGGIVGIAVYALPGRKEAGK